MQRPPQEEAEEPSPEEAQAEEPVDAGQEQVDPCALEDDGGGSWLEWTRDHVGLTVCRAALWFDGLFGAGRIYEERDATFGWVQPSLTWDGIDGLDPGIRLRAKVSLPRFDRRMSALLGRTDPEGIVEDSAGSGGRIPDSFRDTNEEWLLGLGYTPVRGNRRRFDLGAGLEVHASPDVFLQARYRRQWFPTERTLVRWRQTGFWHSEDGLGTATRIDVERLLARRFLLRWRTGGKVAQRIEGVDWLGEVVLFHHLDERQALAYRLAGSGESRAEVPNDRYDLSVTYRRRFLRDFLFLELRPGATWRRAPGEVERELAPVMGVAIELQFGDWPQEAARP